jgi:Mg-chelatase subunit ChlD
MIQRGLYLLCCALLVCITSQDQATAQETPLQPPTSSAIQVYLTAPGKGDSASILTPSELSVSIDKQPAQVTSLHSAKEDKLLFALLVDISTSEASHAESIKKAAMLLFQSLSTGGNQGYLVVFDHQALKSKIPLPPPEARKAIDGLKFGGGTALYDAIWETCRDILSRTRNPDFPRRAIILISDGEDNSSHVNHKEAIEIAEKQGVPIFSLAAPNPRGEQILGEISNSTGGRAIFDKDLEEGVAPLLTAINGQWVLSLVFQQTPDQKLHSLAVKTTQRHVSLPAPAKILLR